MSSHAPPAGFVLTRATRTQGRLTLDKHPEPWRRQLSLELYHEREEHVIEHSEMGRTSQYWVLVPEEDRETRDFVCACETFRRPVLVAHGGKVVRTMSYAVTAVVTPPEHQRLGYAQLMMTLLNEQLAGDASQLERDLSAEESCAVRWTGGRDSILSFLFSYAGDYYSRCGRPGYQIQGVDRTTIWAVNSVPPLDRGRDQPRLSVIAAEHFARVAEVDADLVRRELEVSAGAGGTRFAVEPSAGALDWFLGRAIYAYRSQALPAPTTWGFSTSPDFTGSFILFTIDPPRPDGWAGELRILRLHAPSQVGAHLIRRTIDHARENDLALVSAWNVPQGVLELLASMGEACEGRTGRREEGLSAVAWYGPSEEVEWVCNEQYTWC